MKLTIIILFILALGEQFVFSQSDSTIYGKKYYHKAYYDNGQLKEEGLIKRFRPKSMDALRPSKRYGKWIGYHKNGKKKFERTYHKGHYSGEAKYWYEDGQTEKEGMYKFNRKTQTLEFSLLNYWNTSGEQKVKDGTGAHEHFSEDGRKWIGNWKDQRRHGKWTLYYPDGRKNTWNYVNGKIEGKYRYWDKDGKLIAEETYKRGKKVIN